MRYPYRVIFVIALVTIILTQFTNCDVYSESEVFNSLNQASCTTSECLQQNADYLEVATPAQVLVPSVLRAIDVGGFCNEADFYDNYIIWEVLINGALSSSCGSNCGKCVNGRFQTQVIFNQQPSNVMQIRIELIGLDQLNNQYTNPSLARRLIQVQTL